MALLSMYMALLSVCRTLWCASRAHLSEFRALLSIYIWLF